MCGLAVSLNLCMLALLSGSPGSFGLTFWRCELTRDFFSSILILYTYRLDGIACIAACAKIKQPPLRPLPRPAAQGALTRPRGRARARVSGLGLGQKNHLFYFVLRFTGGLLTFRIFVVPILTFGGLNVCSLAFQHRAVARMAGGRPTVART